MTPAVHFRDPKQSNLSALHIASAGGHNALVELLLLNGADIDQLGGGDGGSALHLAVLTKHLDTCTLLITKGAKVGLLDAQGRTAVDLAMEQAKPSAAGAPDPQSSIIFGMLRLAKAAEDDARRNREAELAQREGYTAATGAGAGEPEAPPPIPTTAPPATPQQKGHAAAAGAAATPVPHTPGEKD
jgi:hypothetical protein